PWVSALFWSEPAAGRAVGCRRLDGERFRDSRNLIRALAIARRTPRVHRRLRATVVSCCPAHGLPCTPFVWKEKHNPCQLAVLLRSRRRAVLHRRNRAPSALDRPARLARCEVPTFRRLPDAATRRLSNEHGSASHDAGKVPERVAEVVHREHRLVNETEGHDDHRDGPDLTEQCL